MRTIGVEEEMLLVDASTGVPTAVAGAVLSRWRSLEEPSGDASSAGGTIDVELQQQMIETDTPPVEQLAELGAALRAWRRRADSLAREAGARVAAIATSPVEASPEVTPKERYGKMAEHFGLTTTEQLTCGCHVHVSVQSPEEGVAVLDRIRGWLPILLALSANSPFWQGRDSGYASFRSQVWNRFPTAGPTDVFGTPQAYFGLVDGLLASGVALDRGMIYFDARLSANYPTVEIRVPDVCLDADDAVLVAALARGLVETASRQWQSGLPIPQASVRMVQVAGWRAGRSGLESDLIDPTTGRPAPARAVVDTLLDFVGDALHDSGDRPYVRDALDRLFARGSGASIQRTMFSRSKELRRVALDAADWTVGHRPST
jgi:carboxylate-amine ligase